MKSFKILKIRFDSIVKVQCKSFGYSFNDVKFLKNFVKLVKCDFWTEIRATFIFREFEIMALFDGNFVKPI